MTLKRMLTNPYKAPRSIKNNQFHIMPKTDVNIIASTNKKGTKWNREIQEGLMAVVLPIQYPFPYFCRTEDITLPLEY